MAIIEAILVDVGGVLMTNGWDHALRKRTAEHFGIDMSEMDNRHNLMFEFFETGKMTFDDYLKRVVFYQKRSFTIQDFKHFVFEAVRPYEETMQFIRDIKKEHHLKVAAITNEGRELAVDRFHRFNLSSFVDFFVASSFVHLRKPDPDIYRLAIDIIQVPPTKIAYIDDRALLIEMGKSLGLQAIHHKNLETTKAALNLLLHKVHVT